MTDSPVIKRHEWLRLRVKSCIEALEQLYDKGDYYSYREQALELSKEINYACIEWSKYYND